MATVPRFGEDIEIDGVRWKRVLTVPNAASNTTTDPYSAKDFNKSLDGKKVVVGDLWDASKEASIKREAKEGKDPIKDKYYKDYAKARRGTKHQGEQKEIFTKQMDAVRSEIKKILPT